MVTFLSGVAVGYLVGGAVTMLLVLFFLRGGRRSASRRAVDPYPLGTPRRTRALPPGRPRR